MSNLSRLTALLFMLVLGCSFQQVGFSNAIHSVSLSASSITVIAGGSQAGQDNLLIYAAITIGLLVVIALIFMRRKPAKKKRSK